MNTFTCWTPILNELGKEIGAKFKDCTRMQFLVDPSLHNRDDLQGTFLSRNLQLANSVLPPRLI